MKRLFDLVISFLALLFLSPVFLLVAILIKLDSRGPVFFRQIRVGLHEKPFSIFKFRSMFIDGSGPEITVGTRDPRITKMGSFLRSTKIDELPQLINVFLGDMSFVGPRPEVPKYVALYSEEQKNVLSVRPGITDLASLAYINENELLEGKSNPEEVYIQDIMPAKLKLNLEYIHHQNFIFDLQLICKTIWKIVA